MGEPRCREHPSGPAVDDALRVRQGADAGVASPDGSRKGFSHSVGLRPRDWRLAGRLCEDCHGLTALTAMLNQLQFARTLSREFDFEMLFPFRYDAAYPGEVVGLDAEFELPRHFRRADHGEARSQVG